MSVRRPLSAALVALLFGASACSAVGRFAAKDKDKDDGEGDAAGEACAADAAAEGCPESTATASTSTEEDDGLDELTSLGLAEFCEFSRNSAGKGCFKCVPRDLPVVECTEVAEDFDAAKACSHDLDRMTCDVGGGNTYGREFGDMTKEEELYSRLPILMFGAKALVTSKLQDDKPGIRDLVLGTFDLITKHKKAIFISGDLAPMAVELEALVRKAKPDLTEAEAAPIREALLNTGANLVDKRDKGELKDNDILSLAQELLAALPPEVSNGFLVNLDIAAITENLKKSGSEEYILELMIMFGGSQSLDELTKQLDEAE